MSTQRKSIKLLSTKNSFGEPLREVGITIEQFEQMPESSGRSLRMNGINRLDEVMRHRGSALHENLS